MVRASRFSKRKDKIEEGDKEGGDVDLKKVFTKSLFEEVMIEQRHG